MLLPRAGCIELLCRKLILQSQRQLSTAALNRYSIMSHKGKHYSNNRTAQIMYKRQLEFIRDSRELKKPHLIMRVMSYNVLADHLLWEHPKLYLQCQPHHKDFTERGEKIIKTITRQDPTVVCLQEVDDDHFESLYQTKLIKYGYEGEFFKRTGEDKKDGIAIFYKKKWFKKLECKKVAYKVQGHRVLDRDNVGIIMALEPVKYKERKLPNKLLVANTHLLFNQRRGDVKLAQLSYLLAELHKMAQKPDKPSGTYYPSFICGDLNAVPFSPLINFLATGCITYKNMQGATVSGQHPHGRQGASISDDILPDFLSHDCRIIDVSAVQDADSPQTNCATIRATENTNSEIDQPTDERQANKKIKTSPSEPIVHHYAFPQAAEEADKMDTIQSAAVKQEGSAESDGSDNQNRSLTVSDILNNLQASTEGGSDAPPPPKQRKKAKKKKPVVPEKPKRDWGILKHSFQFISAYEHYKIDRLLPDYHPEVTTKHFDEQGLNVDYIFSTVGQRIVKRDQRGKPYITDIKHNHLTLLTRYGLLSEQELQAVDTLPNGIEPSDHLPIVAEYALHN